MQHVLMTKFICPLAFWHHIHQQTSFSPLFFIFLHTEFFKHEIKFISSFNNISWSILLKLGMVWTHSVPGGTSWVQTIPRYSKIATRRIEWVSKCIFSSLILRVVILLKRGMVWTHEVPTGTEWVQTIPSFTKIHHEQLMSGEMNFFSCFKNLVWRNIKNNEENNLCSNMKRLLYNVNVSVKAFKIMRHNSVASKRAFITTWWWRK